MRRRFLLRIAWRSLCFYVPSDDERVVTAHTLLGEALTWPDGLPAERPLSKTIHTIHVPAGWTAEQTWETISRGELVPDCPGEWTNVEVEGLTTEDDRVTGGRLVAWHPVEAES